MVCKKTYPYHPLCCRFLLVQEKSNGFQWNWILICTQIKMQVFQCVFHSLSDFLHSHDGILLTLPLGYCTFCKPYLNQVILGEKVNMGDTYKIFEIFLLITVFPSFNTARWVKFCYQLLKKLLLITMFPSFNTARWVKQVFKSIFIRREYLPKYLSRFSLLLCCWFGIQRWTELIHSRMSLFIGKAGSRKCI